ncbi:glycosyltransferase family 2 protein [Oscillibacter sp.]|uniref:glycosyltransferase family 2 protein n=1 Tax=Oscillibacter sp. TaxID=1945593 RepID=UPI00289677BD|nr:glycosyltransferase family 2 protein [Oscillibacter sp.]
METIKNYGIIEDCFAKTAHVTSTLLWGNPEKTPQPWLTVLIPTYRRPMLLKQAIESVLTQQHTDCCWELLIVDNEPYDGRPNATEALIRKIDDPRILYYRNSENVLPGDNFNRGILLARGEWVSILHDDDILIRSSLRKIKELITSYETVKKPIGAITAGYVPFRHDPKKDMILADIVGLNNYYSSLPTDFSVYKNTLNSSLISFWFGNLPSNGSVFNRKAMLEFGGFNESNGICADIILLYNMSRKFSVYSTYTPLGLYRIGYNVSLKKESIERTIKGYHELCEFIFSRNFYCRIMGFFLKENTYHSAVEGYISGLNLGNNEEDQEKISYDDYADIHPKRPSKFGSLLLKKFFIRIYNLYKKMQTKRLCKKAMKGVQE